MQKILCYLIKVSTLLSNIRLSALFRRLEESTQWRPFYVFNKMPDLVLFEKKPQYVYDRNCKIIKLFILGLGRATFVWPGLGLVWPYLHLNQFGSPILLTIIQLKMPFFLFWMVRATQNLAQAESGHSKPMAYGPNSGSGFWPNPALIHT